MTETASANPYGALTGTSPVFLSSVYRSGSTFMAGVLNCHPNFVATSSSVKFLRFCLDRYDPIEEKYETLVRETWKRINTRWDLSFDIDRVISQAEEIGISYAALYDTILRHSIPGGLQQDINWVEKIAIMWSRIPDFLEMFPQGKVIHVLRDPRSITASYKKETYEPGYTYLDAAFNFLHAVDSVESYRDEFGEDRVLMVQTEHVSANPETELRRICDFLEVGFSERMLDPDRYGTIVGEDWQSNTSFGGRVAGFSPPTEHWREHMSKAETMFVEMITQPKFSRYGYVSAGHTPAREDWDEIYKFISDPFIATRFQTWLQHGKGSEGYRSDPIKTELKIVFGDEEYGS